jgi:hypothetical protein
MTGECRGYSIVSKLFFTNKSLTKPDWCAGALWRRNLLLVLHFLKASLLQHP